MNRDTASIGAVTRLTCRYLYRQDARIIEMFHIVDDVRMATQGTPVTSGCHKVAESPVGIRLRSSRISALFALNSGELPAHDR